jgi:hypothetical protein
MRESRAHPILSRVDALEAAYWVALRMDEGRAWPRSGPVTWPDICRFLRVPIAGQFVPLDVCGRPSPSCMHPVRA